MGEISYPSPVARLIVAFSASLEQLAWGRQRAEAHWGPLALASEPFHFQETDYYQESMGGPLSKQFWIFEQLADPAGLADWKRTTNAWELECAHAFDKGPSRPLNLDSGYLDLGKFVLASSKDHAHRVYLRDGIYAEVTLYFREKQWREREWTFPDYRRPDYQAFLLDARNWYRSKSRPPLSSPAG